MALRGMIYFMSELYNDITQLIEEYELKVKVKMQINEGFAGFSGNYHVIFSTGLRN